MSRRTAEADKAIRLAWENERALVKEGKGTRDWTAEQQKDILDPNKGKAYDENGRAFEGQHMKSAEKYPKYQGDPGNIQFLTRAEHLEAHQGNWQNPTNWYFNPVTKEIYDFGEGKYIPCKRIKLSKPIAITVNKINPEVKDMISNKSQRQENVHNKVQDKPQVHSSSKVKGANAVITPSAETKVPKEKTGLNKVIKFYQKHKKIIKGVVSLGALAVTVVAKIGINCVENSESSNDNFQSKDNDLSFDYEENSITDDDLYNEQVNDTLEKSKRSSPCEHEVKGHSQLYHTKNGDELREKAPYSRGGKKEDDIDSKH